jgi:hypothetical protein
MPTLLPIPDAAEEMDIEINSIASKLADTPTHWDWRDKGAATLSRTKDHVGHAGLSLLLLLLKVFTLSMETYRPSSLSNKSLTVTRLTSVVKEGGLTTQLPTLNKMVLKPNLTILTLLKTEFVNTILPRLLRDSPVDMPTSLPETLMPSRLPSTNNQSSSSSKLTKVPSNSTHLVLLLLDVALS